MSFFSTMFSSHSQEQQPLVEPKKKQTEPQDKTADEVHSKGMHNTACTDIFCLLVFLAYLAGMVYVMCYAVEHGDPRRLTHGFDYSGQLCGVDPNVSTKPMLFWCGGEGYRVQGMPATLNFEDPICVETCPTDSSVTTVASLGAGTTSAATSTSGYATVGATAATTVVPATIAPATTSANMAYAGPTTAASAAASTTPLLVGLSTGLSTSPTVQSTASATFAVTTSPTTTVTPFVAPAIAAAPTQPPRLLQTQLPYFYCPTPSNVQTVITGQYPEITRTQTIVQSVQRQQSYRTKAYMGRYCVPDVPLENDLMQELLNSTGMGGTSDQAVTALGGIKRAWHVVAISCVVALILCFVYLILLRYVARILIYVVLIALTLGFLVIGAALICTSQNWTGNQDKSPMFQRLPHNDAVLYSEIGGGVCLVFGLVFVVLLVCFNHLIQLALRVIEAACECMFGEFDLLLQPICDVVLRLSSFCVLAYGFLYVCSIGEITADNDATIGGRKVSGVSRSVQYTDNDKYMIGYYIFGYFWIMEYLNALGQFVIAYMVVLWYYTKKGESGRKKFVFCAICRGYGAGLIHSGSIAFGAFLIAVLRFIRLILSIVAKQADAQGNKALACVAKCLMCCVDCFKRFMEYINKNAYIDIAISSNNFCVAAKHSFEFLFSNAATVALMNGACFVFVWAGVAIVAGSCGYGSYIATVNYEPYNDDTSDTFVAYPEAVGIASALVAGVIALCFMNVFDMVADTLLYCYMWNKNKDPEGVKFYAPDTLAALDK